MSYRHPYWQSPAAEQHQQAKEEQAQQAIVYLATKRPSPTGRILEIRLN